MIQLQPGQPDEGMTYNPRKSLPYPIVVGDDDRCENVPGYPLRRRTPDRDNLPLLVGFQPDPETRTVALLAEEWRRDVQTASGLVPVFIAPGPDGRMFNLTTLITDVQEVSARAVEGPGR